MLCEYAVMLKIKNNLLIQILLLYAQVYYISNIYCIKRILYYIHKYIFKEFVPQ